MVKFICISLAAVLVSGIVTIGAMNLFCTDELYTVYQTEFTSASVINGILTLAATAGTMLALYKLLKKRNAAVVVFVLAFAVRLAAALFWRIEPESDFAITYELGKLIAHTPIEEWGRALDDYGTSYNDLWAVHMPFVVYQGMLLKITDSAVILRLANTMFSFGSCYFTVSLAEKLGGERAKRAALTFTAFNPVIIFFIPVLTNQHVSQFFFVFGLWLFMGCGAKNIYAYAWSAALCFGVSQLLRPEMLVVVIAAAVYVIYSVIRSGGAAKKLIIFVSGLCVFLAVIAAMNTFLTSIHAVHRNIYSGNLNYKIMVGLNPETNGSWSASDSGLEGNSEAINSVIRSRLKENPLKLAARLYGKSVYQLGSYVYTWSYRSGSEWISQMLMRRCGAALMLIVCTLAAWNVLFHRQERFVWLYMTMAAFAAVYAVIEVQSRYNFVFIPVLILIASVTDRKENR
ncbi:MAG: hypothetical protein Q4G33_03240 [bacterium]|nr:hypothetical protein [bacterium]